MVGTKLSIILFPDGSGSAEEAQKSVRGMEENAIHAKYIELVNLPLFGLYITLATK